MAAAKLDDKTNCLRNSVSIARNMLGLTSGRLRNLRLLSESPLIMQANLPDQPAISQTTTIADDQVLS